MNEVSKNLKDIYKALELLSNENKMHIAKIIKSSRNKDDLNNFLKFVNNDFLGTKDSLSIDYEEIEDLLKKIDENYDFLEEYNFDEWLNTYKIDDPKLQQADNIFEQSKKISLKISQNNSKNNNYNLKDINLVSPTKRGKNEKN